MASSLDKNSPFSGGSSVGGARNGRDSAFGGTESDSMLDDDDDNYNASGGRRSFDRMKPRIMLMGLKRSGKSSIQKVVFQKMSPNETLFLESTTRITKEDVSSSSFIQFQVWEYPGQLNAFDPSFDASSMFEGCGAVIYVIDAQEDYSQAVQKLIETVTKAYKINSKIKFEVFIHKVDGLSEENKIEVQRDVYHRANEDLIDGSLDTVHLSFYLTSIYDHSIFEAISKVVQKLLTQLPSLERLLDIFISNCNVEKAFLFDVASKIYVATDASPVDMQSYELCCDMIDVAVDISSIYGFDDEADYTLDSNISAVTKLNNNTVLCLKEVNRYLALVCIMRLDSFERQGGSLLDYNFEIFKGNIAKVFHSDKTPSTATTSGGRPKLAIETDSHFSTEESQLDR